MVKGLGDVQHASTTVAFKPWLEKEKDPDCIDLDGSDCEVCTYGLSFSWIEESELFKFFQIKNKVIVHRKSLFYVDEVPHLLLHQFYIELFGC
jgi:hypothetical protein